MTFENQAPQRHSVPLSLCRAPSPGQTWGAGHTGWQGVAEAWRSGVSCGVRDQPCWGMGGSRGARWDGMMSRGGTWGDHDGTPKVPVHPQSSETLCTPPLWMTRQRRRRRRGACPGEGTHCPERWGCSRHACKNKHNGPSSNVGQS